MMEQSKAILLKRARAKFLSKQLSLKLIEFNPTSKLITSYRRSTDCASVLLQTGKKLTTTYCKNRWCPVCNRIRTAKLMIGYLPVIRAMEDTYFVTLTVPTVTAQELPERIKKMRETLRSITNGREGRRRKVRGIRKAECTPRPNWNYHYHYHLIVEGRASAEWIVSQWLLKWGGLADARAQDSRPADEKSLKELFKYFTKLTVKGEFKLIDFQRMDVIFNALKGTKVYQPFGKVKPISEEIQEVTSEDYDFLEECEQVWKWDVNDWINGAGECLTNYNPNEEFKALFESNKDTARNGVGTAGKQP